MMLFCLLQSCFGLLTFQLYLNFLNAIDSDLLIKRKLIGKSSWN